MIKFQSNCDFCCTYYPLIAPSLHFARFGPGSSSAAINVSIITTAHTHSFRRAILQTNLGPKLSLNVALINPMTMHGRFNHHQFFWQAAPLVGSRLPVRLLV